MRKVTDQTVNAFTNNTNKTVGNTSVQNENGDSVMRLHGHPIARKSPDGTIMISNCGWQSNTTKERLNGILSIVGGGISQKKGVWYLTYANGETVVMESKTIYTIN
jgi:hypothetical protein